ncbi:Hypothetical predicted protein [Marmota monax]|uniref:beta-D-galactosyl-(1->3)-N-acetyl-beta-D-galactosaminide alpha-2,3-sialyltransferase n=1 Tax=Marmota monax TaxID=9995 RepID=A0A5E4CB72_MARMO|nr:hypothetical protein GHT09_003829 [Marmota monax]VTJ78102.1 Hypothetical predicted protein [Marmota monax]
MNKAPVQGFETDVGNTTTLRIMQPEIASTESPEPQLLLPLNSSGLRWMMTVLRDYKLSWKPRNPGYVRRDVHCIVVTGTSKRSLLNVGVPQGLLDLGSCCVK